MGFSIDRHLELTQVTTYQDTALGIMRWGMNNAYPQSLKNFIEQSPNGKPAVYRTAKFFKGAGFEGQDEIIHPSGLTLGALVDFLADNLAAIGGFGIHCNYNLKGEVVNMIPLDIVCLRLNELDELNFSSKIGFHPNFGRNSEVKKTVADTVTKARIKWFNRFNPGMVEAQIKEAKGIQKYSGQVLYFSNAGYSSYPIPTLQPQINFVLADVENSILVRKETATGFINSYILKTTMDATDASLIAMEEALASAQGARGSGKIVTFSGLSEEEVKNTLLEEIGSGAGGAKTIIDTASATYSLCRSAIIGAYLIPPILAGADQATGFTTQELKDAYFVFNANTQEGRSIIEREVNKILKVSNFKTKEIHIKKLSLDEEEKEITSSTSSAVEKLLEGRS